MARQFEEKVAIVTGAAYGIGRATAVAFAREGAKVVVSDVSDVGGEETVALIRKAGGNARFARCDISNADQVRSLIDGTVSSWGRIDAAFNNAGIEGTLAPLTELSEAAFRRVIDVNLTGQFFCMQRELAQMVKQGSGAIVNNASILGHVGFATAGAYTAAKHGLLGLTKVAALEYGPKNIRVNAVCPAFIVTPMLERAGMTSNPEVRKTLESLHALKRMGQPEEVAETVLFLCSDKASFITGVPMLVDAGWCAQ